LRDIATKRCTQKLLGSRTDKLGRMTFESKLDRFAVKEGKRPANTEGARGLPVHHDKSIFLSEQCKIAEWVLVTGCLTPASLKPHPVLLLDLRVNQRRELLGKRK